MWRTTALTGIVAVTISAQVVAQEPEPRPVKITWDTGSLLVVADSSYGVLVAVAGVDPTKRTSSDNTILFSVDPSLAFQWTQTAHWVLDSDHSQFSDTAEVVSTPPLTGNGNGVLFLQRAWSGTSWVGGPHLYVAERLGESAVTLQLNETLATNFVETFRAAASAVDVQFVRSGSVTPPVPLRGNRRPEYPGELYWQEREGGVWLAYTVGTNGRVDVTTAQVLFSDNDDFTRVVLQALRHWRYEPAVRDGQPVSYRIYQYFTFKLIG